MQAIGEKKAVGAQRNLSKGRPKYGKLAEHFRARIRRGELQPGDQLPTFAQLQADYDASRPTAERMLGLLERDGLIDRRNGNGIFVASAVAASPARKGLIGLCGWGFDETASSPYWMQILSGIQRQSKTNGSQVMLLERQVADGWEKADGVIITDYWNRYYQQVVPAQMPLVYLFGLQPDRAGVAANEYSGIRLATRHLLELGHERIAYLHGSNKAIVDKRMEGYRDELIANGIKPLKKWLRVLTGKNDIGPQFLESGQRDMTAWLQESGKDGWHRLNCTALLCHNDDTAIGAMQALNEAGLRAPEDVSIVGFDGTSIGEYSSPRLTSVEMPLREMGKTAIELLQRQIEADETFAEHKTLPTQLRVRQSTAAPSNS